MIRNQQNLYPKFLLLSLSSYCSIAALGSDTGMGFLCEMRSAVELKMVFFFKFWVLFKNSGLDGCKMHIN